MERLPKKYFGSISDYVKTYYTAWGVTNFADKAYTAIKTVTKDFTRTDPVFVRVGEDGEPEIHYTMTQADGVDFFKNNQFTRAHLYVHNGKIITNATNMFEMTDYLSIHIDELTDGIYANAFANGLYQNYNLTEFTIGNAWKPTGSLRYLFNARKLLKETPAIDCSDVTDLSYCCADCISLTAFHCFGMKVSFDLSSTALKHDAILEVFNNLGTVDKTAGITLTLGSEKLALMSDAEKAIATEKGWFLA